MQIKDVTGINHALHGKIHQRFWFKKVSSYLKHWDVNNLYEWAISQKLSIGGLNLKKI